MDLYKATTMGVVLIGVLGFLVLSKFGADAILLTGLGVLLVAGVIDAKTAAAGFANEGMLTVAALFVVAAGVRQTGAMTRLAAALMGRSTNAHASLARLMLPVAGMSAFLNNTPIVAALMPAVSEWARRHRQPVSRYLLPLSYAAVLGGTITVIGTSTNLVVTGLIERNLDKVPGLRTVEVFDITGIGLAVATVGCLITVVLAPWLLPDRRPVVSAVDDPRMYTSEFLVRPGSTLVGRTIEEAGLRHLPGAFLAEIDRGTTVMPAVEPTTHLEARDRLVFVGPREAVVDLGRVDGLEPARDQAFKSDGGDRCLVEGVVAPSNPLVGRSIRDGAFRATFHAVVVAVARDGHRVGGKIGDIVLQAGDMLLMETHPSWLDDARNRRGFYVVTEVQDSSRFRHDLAWPSVAVLVAMVIAAATGVVSMFVASVVGAAAIVALGCISGPDARRSVEMPVLLAIAAALGIGEGIRASGLDGLLADTIVGLGASTPYAGMIAMYVATALLTEVVTNNAAAALMFPFGISLAERFGVSPMPFCVGVMFAASASFSTPIGYQTNLMVYGPGGYRFTDYLRTGVPLQIAVGTVSCVLIPMFFPFG